MTTSSHSSSPALAAGSPWVRRLPWLTTLLAVLMLLSAFRPPKASLDGADLKTFGQIPVSFGGREKPLDSVARDGLRLLSGRQTLRLTDTAKSAAGSYGNQEQQQRLSAIRWLLEVQATPEAATRYPVFRVDHPEVLALFGQQGSGRKHFSYAEIFEYRDELLRQDQAARNIPRDQRTLMQRKVLELSSKIGVYFSLVELQAGMQLAAGEGNPAVAASIDYREALAAFATGDIATFNARVSSVLARAQAADSGTVRKARVETLFRQVDPFYQSLLIYVVVALLVMSSWLLWPAPLLSTANKLLVLALIIHTVALVIRVYLSGRPPVTNLYSSAVFIGWGTVLLSLFIERFFAGGMGAFTGALAGALTLLVAAGLEGDGDTMAVLQAVLDTNFWLATHVVVITLGYSAAFLAGFLGILFLFRGIFTRSLTKTETRRFGQMIYGTICFTLLFSFVGTVLGGIWADQSWGRFWGWDPKENGALLIVLWNALILHARFGGMIQVRGMAVCAIFGNIVTAWSWFGVNMLGVGLHSYGFIDAAFLWLIAFVTSQLVLIALGSLPIDSWRSREAVGWKPPQPASES